MDDDDDKVVPFERPKVRRKGEVRKAAAAKRADTTLTQKQEEYCQLVVAGMSKASAANLARIATPPASTAVKKRIAALRERALLSHDISVEKLLNHLEEVRREAMKDREFTAATSAIMGMAKIVGLLDVKESPTDDIPKPAMEPVDVTHMTLAEWTERFGPKVVEG